MLLHPPSTPLPSAIPFRDPYPHPPSSGRAVPARPPCLRLHLPPPPFPPSPNSSLSFSLPSFALPSTNACIYPPHLSRYYKTYLLHILMEMQVTMGRRAGIVSRLGHRTLVTPKPTCILAQDAGFPRAPLSSCVFAPSLSLALPSSSSDALASIRSHFHFTI